MAHVLLKHWAAQHPHVARLRRRVGRLLRPIRPSHRAEITYLKALRRLVMELRTAGTDILADIRGSWPHVGDASGTIDGTIDRVARRFGDMRARARQMAAAAVELSSRAVDDRLIQTVRQSIGVDITNTISAEGPIANALEQALNDNVDLITSIPERYFDQLRDVIDHAWQNGMRWETLVEQIQHVGDVTESRAALIARDQTSKMNAAFNQVRQTEIGIEQYVWQTSGDERVRESHAELNGETFDWDNPPDVDGENVNPGEAINCRCVAIPVVNLDDVEQATGEQADDDVEEAA